MENQNVRLAISFVIGLLVGLGGYWLWANRTPATSGPQVLDNEMATTTEDMQNTSVLSVSDQAAGSVVVIDSLTLKAPGWVAIHDDVNGMPGKILGARLFDKGTTKGEIELLRKTVPGTSYIVMVHGSDGDTTFSSKTDKPLTDDKGEMVTVTFKTTGGAAAATEATPTAGFSGTVDLTK
jgi:hypothetical protein